MTTTIRQYCAALRKDGFTLRYRDRHRDGTVTEFFKRVGDREVEVQLWAADGKHRACHMNRINNDNKRWRGNTLPTYFIGLDGMKQAIAREWAEPVVA